jgi:hypothetical protein
MAFPSDGFPELAALGVIILLVAVSRWVFRPSRPHRTVQRMDATDARELGLLVVVATVGRADAQTQRATLADAGIRASTSLRADGRFDLLVFAPDVDRARELLSGDGPV